MSYKYKFYKTQSHKYGEISSFFTQLCYASAITVHYLRYFTSLNLQNNSKGEILIAFLFFFSKKETDKRSHELHNEQEAEFGLKNQIHLVPKLIFTPHQAKIICK